MHLRLLLGLDGSHLCINKHYLLLSVSQNGCPLTYWRVCGLEILNKGSVNAQWFNICVLQTSFADAPNPTVTVLRMGDLERLCPHEWALQPHRRPPRVYLTLLALNTAS